MRLEDLRGLIDIDRNLGLVWPPRPLHPLPDKGARWHGLSRLRDFMAALVYRRTISGGRTQGFKVPPDQIHIYAPDQAQENPQLPGIGILPGPASYDEKWVYALGRPDEDENTIDKYGAGTVLVTLGYYCETITVEVVASRYPVLRAIVEGFRYSCRFFSDDGQLYLKCPAYYDQLACFMVETSPGYGADLGMEIAGRRVGHVTLQFWIPEVALIDYRNMRVLPDYGPGGAYIRDGGVYRTLYR